MCTGSELVSRSIQILICTFRIVIYNHVCNTLLVHDRVFKNEDNKLTMVHSNTLFRQETHLISSLLIDVSTGIMGN